MRLSAFLGLILYVLVCCGGELRIVISFYGNLGLQGSRRYEVIQCPGNRRRQAHKRDAFLVNCQKLISPRVPMRVSVNDDTEVIYHDLSRPNFLKFGNANVDRVCIWIVSDIQLGVQS
jgi:hypothetical protein